MGIQEEITNLKSFSEHIDTLISLGFDLEGKVIKPLCSYLDNWLEIAGKYYFGEDSEDLQYFAYELIFGEKRGEVEVDGRNYVIDSVESFMDYYNKEFAINGQKQEDVS